MENKKRVLKIARKKYLVASKGKLIITTAYFSTENLKVKWT
jgi:hypothetical protein